MFRINLGNKYFLQIFPLQTPPTTLCLRRRVLEWLQVSPSAGETLDDGEIHTHTVLIVEIWST